MVICKQVRYFGRVQGVGFRYCVQRLAEGSLVSGYVRNLPSGEVELWVEGEAEDVQAFLAAIARQMEGFIQGQKIRDELPQALQGFRIRC